MQTKIVCTIGPASGEKETLKEMMKAGMNVARINFSHGTHESNGKLLKNIRQSAYELKKDVGIMTDLQGPRIRMKSVTNPVEIKKGQKVFLFEGEKLMEQVQADFDVSLGIDSVGLLKNLKPGDPVYIDNGMMELKVLEKESNGFICEVMVAGTVQSRKGLNIPRLSPKMEAFTKSDKKNLDFILSQNIDFIAMSFVKSANDILSLRKRIKSILKGVEDFELPSIIAKIETAEAVKNFDEIVEVVDGVMIARGDLALEQPMERIPAIQKKIIKKCLNRAKPVIVATQMLESMMVNPRPTRAEISDVANAVIDHTDAVMLSGESAMGKYPIETVQTMAKIIEHTEEGPYDDIDLDEIAIKDANPSVYIVKAALMLAKEVKAKNIVIKSSPYQIAHRVSRFCPEMNIFLLTRKKHKSRKLALAWGVKTTESVDQIKGDYVLIRNIEDHSGVVEYVG
jgi:pyruvate kinase